MGKMIVGGKPGGGGTEITKITFTTPKSGEIGNGVPISIEVPASSTNFIVFKSIPAGSSNVGVQNGKDGVLVSIPELAISLVAIRYANEVMHLYNAPTLGTTLENGIFQYHVGTTYEWNTEYTLIVW